MPVMLKCSQQPKKNSKQLQPAAAAQKFYAAAKYTTFVKGKPRSGKAAAAKE